MCVNYLFMLNEAVVQTVGRKLFVYMDMTFGEWLRKNLNDRGISNAEFARRVDVSGTYIGNLVRDYSPNMTSARAPRPSEAVVAAMAKALEVPLNEARLAAGYAPIGEETNEGLFSGIEKLSPERQKVAKQTIRALIDSLAAQENHNTQND